MEAMRQELEAGGYQVNVVAINVLGGESSQQQLVSRCSFDLLQDVASVGAWTLMDGNKDDMFIYREGGRLAPSGYLPITGPLSTILSTTEGYDNVYNAIVAAHDLGPGETCEVTGGWQVPGNLNQDSRLDISDAISLLVHLFVGAGETLPCGETLAAPGNLALLDLNRDTELNVTDVIHLLDYLFTGGPPPVPGTECTPLAGCPDACP